jgi:hypothetical protein
MARDPAPNQRRIRKIDDRLQRLIGEGPAALFRDACRLADDGFDLETQAALTWHCVREIDTAIHDALLPVAPLEEPESDATQTRRKQADGIIQALELPKSDPALLWWRKVNLAALAHRPNLEPPRTFTPGDWHLCQGTVGLPPGRTAGLHLRGHVISTPTDS